MRINIFFREDYYLVTYSSQRIGSMKSHILKTVVTDKSPLDFLFNLKKENDNIEFAIIYCERISKKDYLKMMKGDK